MVFAAVGVLAPSSYRELVDREGVERRIDLSTNPVSSCNLL